MRSTTSRAVRVTCIALASALCVPASAAPSGEVFVKLPPGSTAAKDDGKHKDQIEILSWSWGATQTSSTHTGGGMGAGKVQMGTETAGGAPASSGGVTVAAGDVNGDGRAELAAPRDSASGLPTGKRQHKPMTISMPLDKGSVILRLASAWPDCRAGTRYPELELGDGAKSYKLQDAIVTSCASESISLNYSKVTVRGWNPEKKEE